MTTIHLTDAQRDTFAACGLIVIDGELADDANPEQCRNCNTLPCAEHTVAPEGWRILTEPCDTCRDYRSVLCRKCGEPIISQFMFGSDATGWEHMEDECGPCPNPDCVGGRRVVTLAATCRACRGSGRVNQQHLNWTDRACTECDQPTEPYAWPSGVVTLGRFTIPELLPSDEVFVFVNGCVDSLGRLDPLPRPGQFIARSERVG